MKPIIFAILISMVIAGCIKTSNIKPVDSTKTNSSDTTTIKLSYDDSIHLALFIVKIQTVKTSVSGENLILTYNENIDLLFSPEGYQKTSSIHLLEDFQNSSMAGFDYTTVAEEGNTTLNWVDDNLNNVILKTVTDTIIGNRKLVKVNVHRTFTFFKIYDSSELATNEQTRLIGKTNDIIAFSSYCYFNQKNYLSTAIVAKVIYTK